jgi:aromatic-amino-acid transaminase
METPNHHDLIPEAIDEHVLSGDGGIYGTLARFRANERPDKVNAVIGIAQDDEGNRFQLPTLNDALAKVVQEGRDTGYGGILGNAEYRKEVLPGQILGQKTAREVEELAETMDRKIDVVAAAGGTGAIQIVMRLIPEGRILLGAPHWGPYKTAAREACRTLETYPGLKETEFGKFEINMDGLIEAGNAEAQKEDGVNHFINSPGHNPTGASFTGEHWDQLIAHLQEIEELGEPTSLTLDLAYQHFGEGGINEDTAFIKKLMTELPNTPIYIAGSLSKSLASYGRRAGGVMVIHPSKDEIKDTRGTMLDRIRHIQRGLISQPPHGMQVALMDLAKDGKLDDLALERRPIRQKLQERTQAATEAAQQNGVPIVAGGFMAFTPLPDAAEVAAKLEEAGIYAVNIGGQGIRVASCSVPANDMPKVYSTLAEVIESVRA